MKFSASLITTSQACLVLDGEWKSFTIPILDRVDRNGGFPIDQSLRATLIDNEGLKCSYDGKRGISTSTDLICRHPCKSAKIWDNEVKEGRERTMSYTSGDTLTFAIPREPRAWGDDPRGTNRFRYKLPAANYGC